MTDAEFLTHLQTAVDLRRKGEYFKALEETSNCLIDRRNESSVWHTLGQIYTERGQFSMALGAHQEAMRLFRSKCNPADRPEQFQRLALGLAHALMRYGRFEEAWPYWEAGRLDASWKPWTGSQYWDGSEPVPEELLVQAEGGYGDLFMCMRWLPFLKQRGVKKVGLMLWPAAEKVFAWDVFGVDEVYVIGRDQIPFTWMHSTSIMSLPAVMKMKDWSDIPPCGTGFVTSTPPKRIGFCWRAEENMSPLRVKSLPSEVASLVAGRLLSDPSQPGYNRGCSREVLSLSPEKADLYSASEFTQPITMLYEPDRMTDWAATRDYILSMDFVVTVDTAVAHMTGLLGVPCLVLLPIGACWRWGMPGDSPPWYSSAMTFYRQKQPLVWDAGEIVAAVKERII